MVIDFVLLILSIYHMMRTKRNPATVTAWLLAMLLLPYLGLALYWSLGYRKLRKVRRRKRSLSFAEVAGGEAPEAGPVDRVLRNSGVAGPSPGNRIRIHWTPVEAHEALMGLIGSAERSLCLEMYIFHADAEGEAVRDRMIERARDGVDVRLVLDDIGCTRRRGFWRPLVDAGARLVRFMPAIHVPFRIRTDLRNHRKMVVADGRCAFAGGRNIGLEYLSAEPEEDRWVDLSFDLDGPAAAQYLKIFQADWTFASGTPGEDIPTVEPQHHSDGTMVQVVPSGPDVAGDPLYTAALTTMYEARRRLWVATPYFVPDQPLQLALLLACRRGLDVQIVTPANSDAHVVNIARGRYLRELQTSGARIWLYRGVLMHAKAVIADESIALVGSANMDVRSFFLNFESMAVLYSLEDIRTVANWVEALKPRCDEGLPEPGPLRRAGESVVRLIEPLL